jgi:cytochrome P450
MEHIEYPNTLTNGIRWLYHPYEFLDEAYAKYGLTFRVALPGAGNALVTGDPRLIQQIVAEKHLVGGKGVNAMRALFGGDSLMMLDGAKHAAHRRALAPAFRRESVEAYDELTRQVTLQAIQQIPFDTPFSMFPILAGITQRIIVRIVFGVLPADKEEEAAHLIHAYMTSFHSPLVLFLKPLRLNLGRLTPWGRITRNRERLRQFIAEQIRCFVKTEANEHSLLARLIETDMTEADKITELFGMLMFGHDTTSVTMAWAFAHIYSHAEVLEQLQEANAGSTSVLEACLCESMRLSPTVVQLLRVAEQDVRIGNRQVRKGETVMPCPYLAHHNPQIFKDPKGFNPERFMNETPPAFAYFPFGLGNRLCAGKSLAERQMPIILATVIHNIELALAPTYQPKPMRYMVFVAPSEGAKMIRRR